MLASALSGEEKVAVLTQNFVSNKFLSTVIEMLLAGPVQGLSHFFSDCIQKEATSDWRHSGHILLQNKYVWEGHKPTNALCLMVEQ